MEKVEAGKKYRHFKGHVIEVVAVARHSETLENMVVYKHLGSGEYWTRPEEMFLEEDDISTRPDNVTGQKHRFELIED
ncbi:MAG: DUF1653 domain-containing protein [Clostridia bacterium]|jgi:hypothetical protein|nr:DUF1653 domain-containing protein [Clostridia bacterium]